MSRKNTSFVRNRDLVVRAINSVWLVSASRSALESVEALC